MEPSKAAEHIEDLIWFGLDKKMIEREDIPQVRNQLMAILKIEEPFSGEMAAVEYSGPMAVLNPLLDYAVQIGLIKNTTTERDLLDAQLMAQLMPRQSELNRIFKAIVKEAGKEAATDFFYELSQNSNYIRMDRIAKNMHWLTSSPYGEMEITINLSKPEKDPAEIAAERNAVRINYPKCLLCLENVGYPGRLNHPGRSNHRVIPVTLDNETWYIQYSPYVYYNEHAIVFSEEHRPMVISVESFKRLIDFVEQYPHYFVGSNADLPIVGGSILSHDHFQGGHHIFPMERAAVIKEFANPAFPDTKLQMLKWPLSVIRLNSGSKEEIIGLADKILAAWRGYSDASAEIFAFSEDVPHNTITPIARMDKDGRYELDLTLRNNRTDEDHTSGIFHPHDHLHHIKKENIGLIEVMGLAVLPDRLKTEMGPIIQILAGNMDLDAALEKPELEKHMDWIRDLVKLHGTGLEHHVAESVVKESIGQKFKEVLECAGVYKQDAAGLAAFEKFVQVCTEL